MSNQVKRLSRTLAISLAVAAVPLLPAEFARAANVTHTPPSGSSNWSTAAWTNGVPNAAGDIVFLNNGATATITLNEPVTIGGLRLGASGSVMSILADGSPSTDYFTMDATGLTAGNQPFGVAGVAFIENASGTTLSVAPNIVIANTDLDIGFTSASTINVSGNITASSAQNMNFLANSGTSGGTITLSGSIGASGSAITISNLSTGNGAVNITGAIGADVASITENSAASQLALFAANTAYAGPITVSQGSVLGQNNAATNVINALGTGAINLNGGTLLLKANGSANNQTIVTGDGTTGNNVTVGGNADIDVNRIIIAGNGGSVGTFTGSFIQFNNLSIGAQTLSVTGGNSYSLQFAGTTTLSGNATFNPTTAGLTLSGVVQDGGNGLGITKLGTGTMTLTAADTYSGPTTVTAGTLAVAGSAGQLLNTSGVFVSGATINVGDNTVAGLANRINPAAGVTLGGSNGGGTFVTVRPVSGNQNQDVASLTLNPGANHINVSGGGVTNGSLNITGSAATAYTRHQGSYVSINNGGGVVSLSFTNTPTGSSVIGSGSSAILIGAILDGGASSSFMKDAAGATTSPTSGTTFGTGLNTDVSSTESTSATATQSLRFTAATNMTLTLNAPLTLESGGILAGVGVSAGGMIAASGTGSLSTFSGQDFWIVTNLSTTTISAPILDNNSTPLSKFGSGNLALTGTNTYAGLTTVAAGTLLVGAGGTAGDLGASSGVLLDGGNITFNRSNAYAYAGAITGIGAGTVTQAGTGALTIGGINSLPTVVRSAGTGSFTLGPVKGLTTLTDNSTTGATAPTTLLQSGATTIATINGASGSVVNFAGDGTGNTTITNVLATSGQLVKVTNGTLTLGVGRNTATNLEVDGGLLTVGPTADRLSMTGSTAGQTLTVTGGELLVPGTTTYGLRLGGDNGVIGAGTAGNVFNGTQTGGLVLITKGGSATSFNLGSTSATVATYNLSGGTLDALGGGTDGRIELGSDTAGTGSATFNLSGGKAIASGQIDGSQGTGAKQAFVWTGGTLVTAAYIATNLTSTSGAAVSATTNTLTNAGGILAPGDIGTGGKTAITGGYSVTSPNAAYAVDIGGTAAATAFQSGAAFYDQTTVSGATSLGGRLSFSLINNYTPPSNSTTLYNVLVGSAAGVTGSFVNEMTATSGNNRVAGADGLSSFLVAINNTTAAATTGGLTNVGAETVALGSYQAGNTFNAASGSSWDAPSAASWTNFDPGSSVGASGAIAQFADGTNTGSGPTLVKLNSTRNIQGVQFSSATSGHNYAINDAGNSTGLIVLDNTANAAAATIADTSAAGNANAINVPITLNSNLNVSIANTANTLTLGGTIGDGGNGKSLALGGNGKLALAGANTYTGPTTINSGVLLAGNASGSATGNGPVSVGVAGILGGTGTITGSNAAVTVNGTITAGNGASSSSTVGLLTTTGGSAGPATASQIWNPAGNYAWKVNPAVTPNSNVSSSNGVGTTDPGGAGVNWDMLSINTLSVQSTVGQPFVVNITPIAAGSLSNSSSYTLADVTSGVVSIGGSTNTYGNTQAAATALASALQGLVVVAPAYSSSYSVSAIPDGGSGDDIVITYSPAPEPTSLMLLGLGASGLLLRRRRRVSFS